MGAGYFWGFLWFVGILIGFFLLAPVSFFFYHLIQCFVPCSECLESLAELLLKVGGHGDVNPNSTWLQSRGIWITYGLGVLAFHIFLLSVPFLTVSVAWTLTNLFHNALHLIFLHTIKGTPWSSQDQGDCRRLTHWEQIDNGLQFTTTRKFLSVTPVVLFFLTSLYTKYDPMHFYINFISLMIILLPKLPQFHKVRLFGINKY